VITCGHLVDSLPPVCGPVEAECRSTSHLGLSRISVTMGRPRRPDHEGRRQDRLTRRNNIYVFVFIFVFISTFTFTRRNDLLSIKQQKIVGISVYWYNRRLLHAEKVEHQNDFQR
jgi:hypothetical protein